MKAITRPTRPFHSLSGLPGGLLVVALATSGCDDTARAVGARAQEEVTEAEQAAKTSAQTAKEEVRATAQAAKAELEQKAAQLKEKGHDAKESIEAALSKGLSDIERAARDAEARIDELDRKAAQRIRDDS